MVDSSVPSFRELDKKEEGNMLVLCIRYVQFHGIYSNIMILST